MVDGPSREVRGAESSTQFDLVVSGGLAVTPSGTSRADIGVSGESIASISPPGQLVSSSRQIVDANGCYVIPGGIDPHCHYNWPIRGTRSESQSHSWAALFGGTTTVIDFALQRGDMTLGEAIAEKRSEADGTIDVDYGLHAIVTGAFPVHILDEIPDMIAAGIPSIKTFMIGDWQTDDGRRYEVMQKVAAAGGLSVVHAEDAAIADWRQNDYLQQGKKHGAYISQVRNSLVEEAAVRRALLLAEYSGTALYVLHMAAGAGVRALIEYKGRGLSVYGETLTPYLCFTSDILWSEGGLLWNNFPTLKEKEDVDVAWQALQDGSLDTVASDHCALKAAERLALGTSVDTVRGGQAGVELRLPILFDLGVQRGRLSVERFVDLVSTNPARIMGLYPKKGVLQVGSDADIVVIDPHKSWTVDYSRLHMSADYSCWQGWTLSGSIAATILRGSILVRDGEFVGPRSSGRFLERKAHGGKHTT
jgi:dihydropyrimidinase